MDFDSSGFFGEADCAYIAAAGWLPAIKSGSGWYPVREILRADIQQAIVGMFLVLAAMIAFNGDNFGVAPF